MGEAFRGDFLNKINIRVGNYFLIRLAFRARMPEITLAISTLNRVFRTNMPQSIRKYAEIPPEKVQCRGSVHLPKYGVSGQGLLLYFSVGVPCSERAKG